MPSAKTLRERERGLVARLTWFGWSGRPVTATALGMPELRRRRGERLGAASRAVPDLGVRGHSPLQASCRCRTRGSTNGSLARCSPIDGLGKVALPHGQMAIVASGRLSFCHLLSNWRADREARAQGIGVKWIAAVQALSCCVR